jgi:hypothetical protein
MSFAHSFTIIIVNYKFKQMERTIKSLVVGLLLKEQVG